MYSGCKGQALYAQVPLRRMIAMNEFEIVLQKTDGETDLQYCKRIEKCINNDLSNRDLQIGYANVLIDSLIDGVYKYNVKNVRTKIRKNDLFLRYAKIVEKITPPSYIHRAILDVINEEYDSVIENIENVYVKESEQLNCNNFVYSYVIPLKEGFPGMWTSIKKIMLSHDVQPGLLELCDALELLYYSDDNEQIISSLSIVISKNPEIYVAVELLGFMYYQMKMWKNAIACLNRLVDNHENYTFFPIEHIYLLLAEAYEKIGKLDEAETYFRKTLPACPDEVKPIVLNSLGYCLYKQRNYGEAIKIFEELVDQKQELPYSTNNLVRTMLAMGQYEKAVSFIQSFDGKISNELVKRANTLRMEKGAVGTQMTAVQSENLLTENDAPEIYIPLPLKKGEQFTNEKLLEDELTLRMERGNGAFGLPLSVYENKSEYGRQYIIPIGRIDILATDTENNLYVIELKKDSGYSDAYAQTLDYVEWIKNNLARRDQMVFGIICLNSPSNKLISQVKANPQMRLFEYSISFVEVK